MTTPRPSAARALPARTSGRASATAPAPATATGTQGNSFFGSGGGEGGRGDTAPQRTNATGFRPRGAARPPDPTHLRRGRHGDDAAARGRLWRPGSGEKRRGRAAAPAAEAIAAELGVETSNTIALRLLPVPPARILFRFLEYDGRGSSRRHCDRHDRVLHTISRAPARRWLVE